MGHWRQPHNASQQHPRTATAVPVRVATVDSEIDPDTGKTFFRNAEATTANLSRGGAYVRSWEPLAPGRRVVVTIDLSDGQELQLVARVAWTQRELRPSGQRESHPPGYGVEFVGGSRSELEALDRHLEGLKPRTGPRTPASLPPATPRP